MPTVSHLGLAKQQGYSFLLYPKLSLRFSSVLGYRGQMWLQPLNPPPPFTEFSYSLPSSLMECFFFSILQQPKPRAQSLSLVFPKQHHISSYEEKGFIKDLGTQTWRSQPLQIPQGWIQNLYMPLLSCVHIAKSSPQYPISLSL